jgi:hypothetical protein
MANIVITELQSNPTEFKDLSTSYLTDIRGGTSGSLTIGCTTTTTTTTNSDGSTTTTTTKTCGVNVTVNK